MLWYDGETTDLGAFSAEAITNLGFGSGTSLADKVEEAKTAYSAGDGSGSREILNAFINELEAQKGKHIERSRPSS
ncbi:MAG: hypothetical protein OEV29_11675 [Thermoleophilia bacterium]|nr:hypothetical protein [Thermoleophilia bacterium]